MNEDKSMIHLPAVLSREFKISRSEARRIIATGGVQREGEQVTDLDVEADGSTLTVGLHRSLTLLDPLPAIALRRLESDNSLDDVVVEDVECFRAEMMDDKTLWLCCYLTNGERITFYVHAPKGSLEFDATEIPDYQDWDERRKIGSKLSSRGDE